MSDLETRLTAALSAGASDAPPTTGLADGARRRLRARRRTRGLVGAVVVALLVAVPGGLLLARDGASPSPEVATDGVVEGGWRTLSYDGIEVDVPADWQRLDSSGCELGVELVGPPRVDPCDLEEVLAFSPSINFDPRHHPGLRGGEGYVYAGDWAVTVIGDDPDVAWRVLASARVVGEEVPDLARGSVELVEHGLRATAPADASGWSVVSTPDAAPRYPTVRERDGRWIGRAGGPGGTMVIDAPTQGLAELIAGSVELVEGDVVGTWRTETWRQVTIDVPADWEYGDACTSDSPVVDVPVGDRLSAGCGDGSVGLGVRFFDSALIESTVDSGTVAAGEDGRWTGYFATAGGYGQDPAVWVTADDRETVQRIIDSARITGEEDAVWRTETWNGISVEVPDSWTPGLRASYCVEGGSPKEGRVETPGTGGREIGCLRPSYGFGVTFGSSATMSLVYPSGHVWRYDAGPMYLAGSWLGYWYDDQDRLVQVNAGDRATVQRVLDSVRLDG